MSRVKAAVAGSFAGKISVYRPEQRSDNTSGSLLTLITLKRLWVFIHYFSRALSNPRLVRTRTIGGGRDKANDSL